MKDVCRRSLRVNGDIARRGELTEAIEGLRRNRFGDRNPAGDIEDVLTLKELMFCLGVLFLLLLLLLGVEVTDSTVTTSPYSSSSSIRCICIFL